MSVSCWASWRLYAAGGTTTISSLLARAGTLNPTALSIATIGLVIGVVGKSAQFPLHGWLPDAMEGPTPVSALIHAATMVAAGVVVLVRLGPLLDRSAPALAVLAVISCVSMLGAGVAALCADDLKRVLAFSTISQIAVMLSALALGSAAGRAGALALMLGHAAFKSLLFLAAGAISVRFGTTRLDGLADLRRRDPRLTVLFGLGLMGLAALPPLAGFVGKEGIFTAAEQAVTGGGLAGWRWTSLLVFASLLLTTVLTACYSARLFAAVTRSDLPARSLSVVRPGTPLGLPVGEKDELAALPPASPTQTVAPANQPGAVRGPGFRPPAETAGQPEPASWSFVDDHGQYQDWDLIADLDTSRDPRWSQTGRAERAYQAELARRRLRAGLSDPYTERLARYRGEPTDDAASTPRTEAGGAHEAGMTGSAEAQSRLARAVSGQRSVAPGTVHPTSRLDEPAVAPRVAAARRSVPVDPKVPVEPVPGPAVPVTMSVPLWLLVLATFAVGVLPFVAVGLRGYAIGTLTSAAGIVLALAGVGLGFVCGPAGHRDLATRLPAGLRAAAAGGFGYQRLQQNLVVRPTQALARLVAAGDDAVIGTWVRAPGNLPVVARMVARVQTGNITGYLGWVAAAAVVLGTAVALVVQVG